VTVASQVAIANPGGINGVRIIESNGYTIFQYNFHTLDGSEPVNWITLMTSASFSYLLPAKLFIEVGINSGTETAWSVSMQAITRVANWQSVNATPSSAYPPVSKEYDP